MRILTLLDHVSLCYFLPVFSLAHMPKGPAGVMPRMIENRSGYFRRRAELADFGKKVQEVADKWYPIIKLPRPALSPPITS